ncbi:MAG: ABC transporter substrate-binding protein, partial [Pseudonocardia sp.]|nr:ABC transporter substrate-binding protein [Pseudonocardia sp.]
KAYRNKYGQPPGGYGVYLYNALKLIASQVAAGKGSPAQFRQALEGQQTTLGQGPMTVRACDHQALTPVYILRGLGANEAASRGGDPKFGLREVVQTIPGTEQYAPSCAEVATEFKGSS